MVYIPSLPRNEQMALARVSGAAIRVTIGIEKRLDQAARLAALNRIFGAEHVPADRRPVLLGILLGISRANGDDREVLARELYVAAGADEAAAAEQEIAHRADLAKRRGGPRH